jgi:hypothetical protein
VRKISSATIAMSLAMPFLLGTRTFSKKLSKVTIMSRINCAHGIRGKQIPRFGRTLPVAHLRAARGLVEHDHGVGQREPLPRCAAGQQQRPHRRGLAHAHRVHRGPYVLHSVVNRQALCAIQTHKKGCTVLVAWAVVYSREQCL